MFPIKSYLRKYSQDGIVLLYIGETLLPPIYRRAYIKERIKEQLQGNSILSYRPRPRTLLDYRISDYLECS